MSPAEPLFVFIDHERNCGSKTFYRPSLNHKPHRPEIPSEGWGPTCTLAVHTEMQQHFKESYQKWTHEELVYCVRHLRVCIFPYFLKCLFRIRVSFKRTCEPAPPLLNSSGSANHLGMEFTSNILRVHVPTAGDIISTLRVARFHAAPRHGPRPHTSVSAETTSRSNVRSSAPAERCSGSTIGPQPQPRTWPLHRSISTLPN